jgi:fumarate reductase flavoprotein subunit
MIVFFFFLVFFGLNSAFALDSKHAGRGLACVNCHQTASPTHAASEKICQSCHGDSSKVAFLTQSLQANPHDSHLGPMECTKCHKEHKESEIVCLECHNQFEFRNK